MIETVNVTINDKKYKYSKDVTLLEIYKEHQTEFKYPIILARVNNRLNELSSKIKEDSIVEFIDLTSPEGNRAHVNGLVFMLLYAVKKLYGKTANITVQHSLDKGIYIQISFKLTEEKVEKYIIFSNLLNLIFPFCIFINYLSFPYPILFFLLLLILHFYFFCYNLFHLHLEVLVCL